MNNSLFRFQQPFLFTSVAFISLTLAACSISPTHSRAAHRLEDIEHIIVIYAENRSFDHLYGLFPGANGIGLARPEQTIQIDHDGRPFATLPLWASEDGQTAGRIYKFVDSKGRTYYTNNPKKAFDSDGSSYYADKPRNTISKPSSNIVISEVGIDMSMPTNPETPYQNPFSNSRPSMKNCPTNQPFRIDQPPVSIPLSKQTRDLVHRFYQNQEQINGGRNNRYAGVSDAGGLVMGYYDGSRLPMWRWAQDYVLADNFFMAAYGGSFLNHQWLICACTPVDPNAPDALRAQVDEQGLLKRKPGSPTSALQGPPQFFDGSVTPDGYVVNTLQPPYQPSGLPPAQNGDPSLADLGKHPLPPQTAKTIGDTLSAKGVSWAWYAGGWDAAVKDGMQAAGQKRGIIYNHSPGALNFQAHHQPFNYFARYAPGSVERARHLRDAEALFDGIAAGQLPQVAFYKPAGRLNEHPGYTDVLSGDRHIADVVERIKKSPLWPSTAIIVTYDENGGFWDHVAPPKGDRFGPGTRVPAIIVSPMAKRGFVDHTVYDTTSIIQFITRRFGLEPLPGVRKSMGDMLNAFAIDG